MTRLNKGMKSPQKTADSQGTTPHRARAKGQRLKGWLALLPRGWRVPLSPPPTPPHPTLARGPNLMSKKDFKLLGAALTSHIPETRKFHLTTINFAYLIFGKHVYIYDAINVTMLHRKRIHKHRMILTWYHRNCRCKSTELRSLLLIYCFHQPFTSFHLY